MTATVGSLLGDVHARTWAFCSMLAEPPVSGTPTSPASLLLAWPPFAAAALRAVDAVGIQAAWLDDAGPVRQVLAEVASAPLGWRISCRAAAGDGEAVRPSAEVLAIRTRLGLIADLLAGQGPARSSVDRAAVAGLRANVLAPVHALAVTTLATLGDRSEVQVARGVLRGVVARTERYALVPVGQRTGRYDDVAAVAVGTPSLDGVITDWARATVEVTRSTHRVTGIALQTAAGDALILTAAAATVCRAASEVGLIPAEPAARAVAALTAAHQAWRPAVAWPATVRLDGVRDLEQTRASRDLRQVITDTLRQDRCWLPAEAMAAQLDLPATVATMRRGLHAVGNVALAHYQAIENLIRGRSQLWLAALDVTQPAFQTAATIEAAVHKRWVPMPRGEPTGEHLLKGARDALTRTTVALAALDATAAAPGRSAPGSVGGLGWDQGRIVAHPDQRPVYETVGTSTSPGGRAERRAPIPLGRPTGPGPRR